jgi:arylsulfatase A-like enzyme
VAGESSLEFAEVAVSSSKWQAVANPRPGPIDWQEAFRGAARPSGIRNVLLIVVDTLAADHLSLYGYPRRTSQNPHRMATAATVFETARSQAACTLLSVNSILASRPPIAFSREPITNWGNLAHYPAIAGIRKRAGMATAAVSASWVVRAPPSMQNNWGGGYDASFDVFDEGCVGKPAACVNAHGMD